MVTPVGGRRRGPYPKLPAGEVEGRASESRREELSHLLSDSGRRGRRLAAPAGPGERPPEVQVPHPGTTVSGFSSGAEPDIFRCSRKVFKLALCCVSGAVCCCVVHQRQERLENSQKRPANHQYR